MESRTELGVRRVLLVCLVLACGATSPASPKREGSRSMSATPDEKKEYAWGEPACGDLVIGLHVTGEPKAGVPLSYKVAFANRSGARRRLVLFHTLDGIFRTRLEAKVAGTKPLVGPAVSTPVPVSSPVTIAVDLEPGEVHEHDGIALPANKALHGKITLQVVHGDTKAEPCAVRSGEVIVDFSDAG